MLESEFGGPTQSCVELGSGLYVDLYVKKEDTTVTMGSDNTVSAQK